jgi:tetratricopeptide (TPR) repeat protein
VKPHLEIHGELLSNVEAQTARAAADARAGNSKAITDLIDGGFELADLGFEFATRPVLEALNRLTTESLLDPTQQGWFRNLEGRVFLREGKPEEAVAALASAEAAGRKVGDRSLVASALLNMGILKYVDGNAAEALEFFRRSNRARPANDPVGRAQGWINLASVYLDLGEVERSRRLARQARSLPAIRGYPSIVSSAIGIEGLVRARVGDLEGADLAFREAARLARRAAAWSHLLPALQNIGAVNLDLERYGVAIRWLRRAARLAELLLMNDVLLATERTLATALLRSRRPGEAVATLEGARTRAIAAGDQPGVAQLSADLGALALSRRRFEQAESSLAAAQDQFIALGEPASALMVSRALLDTLAQLRRMDRADEVLEDTLLRLDLSRAAALSLREDLGDSYARAHMRSAAVQVYRESVGRIRRRDRESAESTWRLGMKLLSQHESRAAAVALTRSLRWLDPATPELSSYQVLNDRALAYMASGDTQRAEIDLRAALAGATEDDDRAMQTIVLSNLSETSRRNRSLMEASEFANRAITLSKHSGDKDEEARAFSMLGLAQSELGDWAGAGESHRRALRIARSIGDASAEAIALGGIGTVHFAGRRFAQARSFFRQAASIERDIGDAVHEAQSRAALAEIAAIRNDRAEVRKELQRAVTLVQTEGASLEAALIGIGRCGGAWLRGGRTEEASDTFYAGIVLALAQWDGTSADGLRHVGRSILAPYVYSLRVGRSTQPEVDRRLRARLRRLLRNEYGAIQPILDSAMRASARTAEA